MRRSFIFNALRLAATLLLAALSATTSPAQASPPTQAGLDPRNFDATSLGKHVVVGPNWLFAEGDNSAWASPSYDDRGWKAISSEKQLSEYGIHDAPYAWYRIHIHLRPGTRGVAVGMATVRGFYAVYANGVLIGNNGAGAAGLISTQRALTVYPIPDTLLSESSDLVLAIRCSLNWNASVGLHNITPITANSIYLFDQATAPIYVSFQAAHAAGAPALLSGLALLAGLIALALFFALRSQMEYLAIAVCLFASTLNAAMLVWFSLGTSSFPLFFLQFMFIGVEMVALIEFVRLVLHLGRTRWFIALEVVTFLAFLIYPLNDFGFLPNIVLFAGFYVPVLLLKIALPVLLIRGWRRGNREALLLLPAILLGCFADYWSFLRDLAFSTHFNSLLNYLPFQLTFGTYQIDFYRVGDLAFYIAILLFLVGRTVRIARERSQAAAELAAGPHPRRHSLHSRIRPAQHIQAGRPGGRRLLSVHSAERRRCTGGDWGCKREGYGSGNDRVFARRYGPYARALHAKPGTDSRRHEPAHVGPQRRRLHHLPRPPRRHRRNAHCGQRRPHRALFGWQGTPFGERAAAWTRCGDVLSRIHISIGPQPAAHFVE
jgi:hypothetical protein